jgi:Flp pilus assembly protein TadB
MKDKASAFFMWIASVPLTVNGIDAVVHGAATIFGMLTAFFGFLMALCGFVWWLGRLRRQKIKLTLEELELQIKKQVAAQLNSDTED